jgi:hypothetical protein
MFKLFLAGGLVVCAATLLPAVASTHDLTTQRETSPDTAALQSDPPAPSAPPSPTEHNVRTAPSAESRRAQSLDIDFTVDGHGFRLGGRLSGDKGVSGAWVGAQVREDGMTLDGQLQSDDGRSREFRLNLGLLPGWARTAARIWLMLP